MDFRSKQDEISDAEWNNPDSWAARNGCQWSISAKKTHEDGCLTGNGQSWAGPRILLIMQVFTIFSAS